MRQTHSQLKEINICIFQFHNSPILICSFFFCFLITLNFCRLRSFSVPEEADAESSALQDEADREASYHPPEITTLYSVSARVEPLFLDANKRFVRVCVCTSVCSHPLRVARCLSGLDSR